MKKGGNHVVGHGVGIGARRVGKRDLSVLQRLSIDVIGPDCGRSHKPNAGVFQKSRIDPCNTADEKYIYVLNGIRRDLAAGKRPHRPEATEGVFDVRDVLIGTDDSVFGHRGRSLAGRCEGKDNGYTLKNRLISV